MEADRRATHDSVQAAVVIANRILQGHEDPYTAAQQLSQMQLTFDRLPSARVRALRKGACALVGGLEAREEVGGRRPPSAARRLASLRPCLCSKSWALKLARGGKEPRSGAGPEQPCPGVKVVQRPPNRRARSGPAHSLTYEDARQGPFLARERRGLLPALTKPRLSERRRPLGRGSG
jgi:hypothetical protein